MERWLQPARLTPDPPPRKGRRVFDFPSSPEIYDSKKSSGCSRPARVRKFPNAVNIPPAAVPHKTRDAKLLHGALIDAVTGPAVARRLSKKNPVAGQPDIVYAPLFEAQIKLVENGGIAQSGAIGEVGQMTQEQVEAFAEMERLLSGARRSANLAFPKMCLTIQNAARLAHPTARAAKDETTLVARNRFLLDEFPPRNREKPEATTPLPTPPTP